MRPLYFAAKWNKQDITKTWSGTSYSLYETLSKSFNVIRIEIPDDMVVHLLSWLLYHSQFFLFRRLIDYYTYYKVSKQIKDKSIPLFSVGAFRYPNPTYIFVDSIIASQNLIEETLKEGWGFNPYPFIGKRLRAELIKRDAYLYKKSEKIFCMGKWLVDLAKSEHKDISYKFIEAGGGCNAVVQHWAYKEQRNRNKILFVGRDFFRKGGDLVVEAFKIAKKKREPLELYIVGPNISPVDSNVPGVKFLGDVSYREVGELMAECDLFCMPSRFEAFGLVFIEALMTGIPCIGRDAYEMKYFIQKGQTGELIHDDNPKVLAQMMISVLMDDKIYENVKNNYADYKNKYSWDTTCGIITQNIYNSI